MAKSILVVDDDADIREAIKEALESEGCTVATASNGAMALEVLQRLERPCLVLLDMMMPIMDGLEFLEHLREDDRLVSLPVVVVSASWKRSAPPGAQEIIRKPFLLEELAAAVHRYCQGESVPPLSTSHPHEGGSSTPPRRT